MVTDLASNAASRNDPRPPPGLSADQRYLFLHARALVRDGLLEDAISAFRKLPPCPEVHIGVGFAWSRLGWWTEALHWYELAPGLAEARFLRAIALLRLRRTADAERDFSEALQIDPSRADAYAGRGWARLETDLERALDDFEAALGIEARCPPALIGRGVVRERRGDIEGAVREYDEALRADTLDATASVHRAIACARLGDCYAALEDLADAIRRSRDPAAFMLARAVVRWAGGDSDGAAADAAQALRASPGNALAHVLRGEILRAVRHRPVRSEREIPPSPIEELIERLDESTPAPKLLVDFALEELARFDSPPMRLAATILRNEAPEGSDAVSLAARGALRSDAGETAEAEADFLDALAAAPEDAEILYLRAAHRARSGDFDGAFEDASRIAGDESSDLEARLLRALVLAARGEAPAAAREIDAILRLSPGRSHIRWRAARSRELILLPPGGNAVTMSP